jgi:hypothetical protein
VRIRGAYQFDLFENSAPCRSAHPQPVAAGAGVRPAGDADRGESEG